MYAVIILSLSITFDLLSSKRQEQKKSGILVAEYMSYYCFKYVSLHKYFASYMLGMPEMLASARYYCHMQARID
jgi:hypothetical protein